MKKSHIQTISLYFTKQNRKYFFVCGVCRSRGGKFIGNMCFLPFSLLFLRFFQGRVLKCASHRTAIIDVILGGGFMAVSSFHSSISDIFVVKVKSKVVSFVLF